MKEQTVATVEWIKTAVSSYGAEGVFGRTMKKTALEFLDSLPGIESRLCRGGYIQDTNGIPCREGDEVEIFTFGRKPETVILKWNTGYKAFEIIHSDGTEELLAAYQFRRKEK